MGRMVGDDAVQRAVFQALDDREPVLFGADGRVDLGVGVKGRDDLVRQGEVVRAGLRRHLHAARLCLTDELHAAVGGDVADMHGQRQALGKTDLARDDDILRRADAALEPRQRGVVPLVDDAAVHEGGVLAVTQTLQPEVRGVQHRVRHEIGRDDALAVLGDGDRARRLHRADRGEVLALLPFGDRADGIDLAKPHFPGAVFDIGDDHLVIGDGLGVGHAAHLGEAALDRGAAARLDILLLFKARLAQMDVHIDEPRKNGQPGAVDALPFEMLRKFGDLAVLNAQIKFSDAAG